MPEPKDGERAGNPEKAYYYLDINCGTRQIIGWGTETKGNVEVKLTSGFHRLFVSRGQYNKLVAQLAK